MLTEDKAAPADESHILNSATRSYLAITTVRGKDAFDAINRLFAQLGTAIHAAARVALIASALVLADALAVGNRVCIHDAAIPKTLGATRRTLVLAFSLEYTLFGFARAVFTLVPGGVEA